MSIIAMTGLPGHGKSYETVKNQIVNALKAGRRVVTNIPLDRDALLQHCGAGEVVFLPEKITAAELVRFCQPGDYIVIDEVARYWPAGLTAKNIPELERVFFSEHRHRVDELGNSTEIVLVVQDLSMIASYIRPLVEQTFRMTKLTSIGSRNRYRIDVYEGAVTGQKPPVSKRIREMYGKYEPEVYRFYKSHTQSVAGAVGNEEKADKRGSILAGSRFKLTVASLVLVPVACWGFYHALHSLGGKAARAPAERSEAGVAQPVHVQQAPVKPAGPAWSSTWRLSGRFRQGLTDYYVIDGDHGGRRVDRHRCHKDDGGEVICEVDGELVANWTGPKAGFVESSLGHTMEGQPVSN